MLQTNTITIKKSLSFGKDTPLSTFGAQTFEMKKNQKRKPPAQIEDYVKIQIEIILDTVKKSKK